MMTKMLARDSAGSRNIAMAYIDHAVSLVKDFNIEVSGTELRELDDFKRKYKELGDGSDLYMSPSLKFKSISSKYSESAKNLNSEKEFHNFDVLATEVIN